MHVSGLPESEFIALSTNEGELAKALAMASVSPFMYFQPITGTERSGRLFSPSPIMGSVRLFEVTLTHEGLASELMNKLYLEARYAVPMPDGDAKKGWEVRKAEINNITVAIVWAAWVFDGQMSLDL